MTGVQSVNAWSSDIHFGAQRLIGCNPLMVKLCAQLPEKSVQTHACFFRYLICTEATLLNGILSKIYAVCCR